MCGIICAVNSGSNKKTINESVVLQFEDQKDRGVNGFGIIKINEDMGYKVERATEGYKFMYDIHQDLVRAMIVHHRIPTSSDNKIKQTHPILVDNGSLQYKYLVVHNGVIRNDDALKKEHEDLGFQYNTQDKEQFNDSEALAIELARFIERQTEVIGTLGAVAFVCAQIDKKTKQVKEIFFGRNKDNPLNMAKTREKIFISSTGPGEEVAPFKLYHFKIDSELKLNKRTMPFFKEEIKTVVPIWTKPILTKAEENWDDYRSYGNYRPVQRNYLREPDDDLPSEEDQIIELVEESHDAIMTELDSFIEMLYEPISIESVTNEDVEIPVNRIKEELIALLTKTKEKHLEIALGKEACLSAYALN